MREESLIGFTLFVLLAAIIVLFSESFLKLLKRIFTIPGATLVLPLLFISTLFVLLNGWILWGMRVLHDRLLLLLNFLSQHALLQQIPPFFLMIALLTLISILPVFLFNEWSLRRKDKPFVYTYLSATILWLIAAFLLVVWA